MPPVCGKNRDIGIDPQRIVAPMPGGDHPAVEIEDSRKLFAVESGDRAPVPARRERRDDAQALFALGWGWRALFNTLSSARSSSISCSISLRRTRTGSQSSPNGVP